MMNKKQKQGTSRVVFKKFSDASSVSHIPFPKISLYSIAQHNRSLQMIDASNQLLFLCFFLLSHTLIRNFSCIQFARTRA